MARVRTPGTPELGDTHPTHGPTDNALAALLRARRFRVGAGAERVARNLTAHGGELAPDAAAWIGVTRPPADAPSIALGEHPGTLGPASFGFLNVAGGVAALDAPLPSLPRRGTLALVAPRRDALPDLVPLALARNLGLSWIVSVGDADPADAIRFLHADATTDALALRLGAGADGASLRGVLGAKPAVVWGGDALCRAVARRAGAHVAATLEEFVARAALLDAAVEPGASVAVLVLGGGRGFVADEVAAAGLDADVAAVDDRDAAALDEAIAQAKSAHRAVLVVAGGPPVVPDVAPPPRILTADLRHPSELRALLAALAAPAPDADDKTPRARVDKELAARVRAEVDAELSDHDAKRLLKAWGVRVSRQAPAPTPTAAIAVAKKIGLPVALLLGAEERVAESVADVKRVAALLLQAGNEAARGAPVSVMVRERFADVPRARVRIAAERGVGLTMRVGEAYALAPLTSADALELARATAARRAADQRALAELLQRVAACAAGEDAAFELDLYIGAEPAVVAARGELRRKA
jgi:hypothetical protein